MGGSMTNLAKQKMIRMESMAKYPYLIKITYEDEENVLHTERYVNADEEKTFENEIYQPAFFTVQPPSRDNSTISDGKLVLSTVDQTWIAKVRNAPNRMKCQFVACIEYRDDNTNYIEDIEKITFTLIKASWDESTLSFTMMFDDRLNLLVPRDVANAQKVAGAE